jgi:hypothetical protein
VPTFFDHISNLYDNLLQINDWRVRENFLREIAIISGLYKADDIFEIYINMTISIVVRGNAAIKQKGGNMIANFIPKVHSFEKRKNIMKKIFESFYKVIFLSFRSQPEIGCELSRKTDISVFRGRGPEHILAGIIAIFHNPTNVVSC